MTKKFEIEKVTGQAKVVNTGQVYSTYRDFAEASGYPDAVSDGFNRKSDKASELRNKGVTLLAKGPHPQSRKIILYVVESAEGERFIFGEEGLEIIEINKIEMPEMTYVEIAEPFGKEVREVIKRAYEAGYRKGKSDSNFEEQFEQVRRTVREETPQEKRDRIVEQAKKDVEKSNAKKLTEETDFTLYCHTDRIEYVVNRDKRTVVALFHSDAIGIIARGIAKCAPGDCFNVHIGKAIALRRALGLDVPVEYTSTPQPTEVRVGDVVEFEAPIGEVKIRTLKRFGTGGRYEFTTGTHLRGTYDVSIIDDSREEASE